MWYCIRYANIISYTILLVYIYRMLTYNVVGIKNHRESPKESPGESPRAFTISYVILYVISYTILFTISGLLHSGMQYIISIWHTIYTYNIVYDIVCHTYHCSCQSYVLYSLWCRRRYRRSDLRCRIMIRYDENGQRCRWKDCSCQSYPTTSYTTS